MGMIDVRRFDVTTNFGPGGELEVRHIGIAGQHKWNINLAELVKVNALAVPADRPVTYRVMKHELRLLLSFLADNPRGSLVLRDTAFAGSSGHVKRFVSESLGLGMLTAAAEHHHRWNLKSSDLYNFDVLPANVASLYSGSGVRPDLLFDFTHQGQEHRLAGEARGRLSYSRPVSTTKDQRNRLAQIVAWSGANGLHPVTMTYTYPGTTSVQVDLFDVTVPSLPDAAPGAPDAVEEIDFAMPAAGQRTGQAASIRSRALARASEIASQLYETAQQDDSVFSARVFGQNVLGSWATANLITPVRTALLPRTARPAGYPTARRKRTPHRRAGRESRPGCRDRQDIRRGGPRHRGRPRLDRSRQPRRVTIRPLRAAGWPQPGPDVGPGSRVVNRRQTPSVSQERFGPALWAGSSLDSIH